MADLQSIELDLNHGDMMRKSMIEGLADLIDALPQYRYAVILELLRRNDISRCLIAEALGEEAIRQHESDKAAEEKLVSSDFNADDERADLTWDEIMTKVLAELQNTPGGRAEVE